MISDSWFTENFTGISDDFFDFPLEDVEGVDDENAKFQNLEPPLDIYLFEGSKSNPISCNRAPQVKPQPSTTDTSSSRSICLSNNSNDGKDSRLLQTSSPVSVLESSSLCSAEKPTPISPELVFAMKRTRSKHRRPASLNSLFLVPFITSTSSASEEYHPSTASESGSEINLVEKSVRKKQKRKKNLTMLSGSREIKKPYFQQTVVPRKCTHCGVSETPQWREGPMGPKTLCNACGVRYRSGRLVPEYRPAASPTFIPSVHSNSHKRIMEMRNKTRQ